MTREQWDDLRHLGGNSPWIRKTRGVLNDTAAELPAGCIVDQVHMMSRHGERYPTYATGESTWTGSLTRLWGDE